MDKELDYVLLACDGIFDVLCNDEINDIIWETIHRAKESFGGKLTRSEKEACLGECVNNILKMSMIDQSEDNVTAILVMFTDMFE